MSASFDEVADLRRAAYEADAKFSKAGEAEFGRHWGERRYQRGRWTAALRELFARVEEAEAALRAANGGRLA